jgi:LysM repeat protein
MRYRKYSLILVSALVITALWVGSLPAAASPAAQPGVLVNPGFEDPYLPFEGDTTRMVAEGWSAWHVPQREGDEGFRNLKPEYQPATAESPDRILAGSNAQQYFSFFATHTGGLYQQVQMDEGTTATFSAFVYVWSTRGNDPDVSEDPGRVQVQVGIDPQGGTDGESERIIWSLPLEYYDQWQEVSVTVEDVSSLITVFVRTTFDLPQKNTVYVDEARLMVPQDEPPTDTPTATATATATTQPPTTQPADTSVPATTVAPTATATTASGDGFPTPTQEEGDGSAPEEPTATPTRPVNTDYPYTVVHRVAANENVGYIAQLYSSSVDAIIAANGLNSEALIFVDQELIIPVSEPMEQATSLPPGIMPTNTPLGIIPTNTPVGIVPTPMPTATPVVPAGQTSAYTVRNGDNLSRLATQFNTTVTTLVQLNGILNPNLIKVGQVLTVPYSAPPVVVQPTAVPIPQRPGTHVVQAGENLFRISLRYGVSLQALAYANGIYNPNWLYAGQVLIIP